MNWWKVLVNGGRCGTALFLYSEKHGVGKNTLTDFFHEWIVGKPATRNANGLESVTDTHSNLSGKILVIVNELTSTKDKFRSNFDKLKSFITDSTLLVNEKNVKKYEVENMTNWVFTTNYIDSLMIDKNDRRTNCIEVADTYKDNITYFDRIRKKYFNKEGGDSFYTYLIKTDFGIATTLKCLDTPLKREMIESNLSPIELFVSYIQSNPQEIRVPHTATGIELYKMYEDYCKGNGIKYVMSNQKFGRDITKLNVFPKNKSHGIIKYQIREFEVAKDMLNDEQKKDIIIPIQPDIPQNTPTITNDDFDYENIINDID
jgi:phage/plasmid-associated DNA primase